MSARTAFSFGPAPKLYQLNIEKFKGVDFANSPLVVDTKRSPDAKNMIADLAGFPVSRTGYETLIQAEGAVNGIFLLKTRTVSQILLHHGTTLSRMEQGEDGSYALTELKTGLLDQPSSGVQMAGKLWLFDGGEALCYGDFGTEEEPLFLVRTIASMAYTPTTIIARAPTGGGTAFEAVNLLGNKRTNSFLGTADDKQYQLDADSLHTDPVTARILNADGEWVSKSEGTDFTVDREKGIVTFTTAPGVSPVTGRDNVEITFSKVREDYAGRINGCDTLTVYGVNGAVDRLFVTGNPAFRNMDWYSEVDDPTYFGDLWYALCGQEATAIMGYSRLGDGTLAIHKQRNGKDPTVFIRTGYLQDNEPVFSLKPGAVGVGAVSKRAFAQLVNDPLFLSDSGVFAVIPVSNAAVNERYAQQRSFFVNPRLIKESGLEQAAAIEYGGFYYLAVNGHVYIADSRQKTYVERAPSDQYQYEWYFFDSMPVRVWFEREGELWFGTGDGKVCRMKKEGEAGAYLDDGQPILCYWKTPILNFGTYSNYKTVKNAYAVPNPYLHSEINIDYVLKSIGKTVKSKKVNIFSFDDLDFEDFSFDTDQFPRIIPTNYKAKKFMLIQFRLWADAGKPFGFYAFTVSYTINSKYKG